MILFHLILFSLIRKSTDNDDYRKGCVLFYTLDAYLIDSLYWQVSGGRKASLCSICDRASRHFQVSLVYSYCLTSLVYEFNVPDWQILLSDVHS